MSGKVYLVGAGPGDPGLITLRGVECLRQANLVLFDYLVNPAIVTHAPTTAEKVRLERHANRKAITPESVIGRMIEAAQQGKTVVRLKGGDPGIFGHLAEELAALRAAAIPYEVVPGITAGLAAAACAEITVTEGCQSSAVALVAGHERGDKKAARLDYQALAQFPGTLVFYMGVGTAIQWSRALIEHGKPPTTPVAIVRRSSWPDQTVTRCTLETLPGVIESQQILPPAVILVGEVTAAGKPPLLPPI
jgi:uroporphyrinogen III methyltransferase / synthase